LQREKLQLIRRKQSRFLMMHNYMMKVFLLKRYDELINLRALFTFLSSTAFSFSFMKYFAHSFFSLILMTCIVRLSFYGDIMRINRDLESLELIALAVERAYTSSCVDSINKRSKVKSIMIRCSEMKLLKPWKMRGFFRKHKDLIY
jgi:hypothetical protein